MPLKPENIDYTQLPPHIQSSMQQYVEMGTPVGDFLYNVLSNSLIGAYKAADSTCLTYMPDIVSFVYNELPGDAWGSPANVANWKAHGGWLGSRGAALR